MRLSRLPRGAFGSGLSRAPLPPAAPVARPEPGRYDARRKPWRSAVAHHEHDPSSAKDGLVNLVLTLALWASLLALFLGVPHLLAVSVFGSH